MSDNENESEDKNIIPVPEEALPVIAETNQAGNESKAEKESFFSRFGKAFVNFLRALVRLIVIALFIFGIGAGLYFGLPYINRMFITPIEENSAQVEIHSELISDLFEETDSLQLQINQMTVKVDTLEKSIESYSTSLKKLDEIQLILEEKINSNQDETLLKLKHEVMLTRAFDMLGRARLYLSQSNFGLAQEDVQSARDLLFELQTETNDEVLNQVVARLDLALSNLPQFPVVASGDLEIAWQILMNGEATAVATSTPTPAPFVETFTPTPFDIPSFTPTP